MRVVLTTLALERVAEIELFIAEKNLQAGAAAAARIFAKVRTLESFAFPRMGRKTPEIDNDDIREVIEDPYRIVYRIRSDELLEVVTVFDGRREEFPYADVLDGE